MFGFLVGTLSLVGLVGLVKSSRHRGGCGGRAGWRETRGGRTGRPGFSRAAAEMLKRRLGVDEDQEGIVDHAVADAFAAAKDHGVTLKESRKEVAAAFEGESVDDASLAAIFARQDEAVAAARREIVSALKQIHAVLEPEQRARAVSWLGAADARWV